MSEKPIKISKTQFRDILVETAVCCGVEIGKEHLAVWYVRLCHIPPEALKKACAWYERRPNPKFLNEFYPLVRAKAFEFANDYSDIMPGAISARPSAEKLRLDAEYRQRVKANLPAPEKQTKPEELGKSMGIPKLLPSPAEVQKNAEEQRKALLEQFAGKAS